MKKYKLIKEYPGSDAVGDIITGIKETMYSKGLGFRNYDWAHVETHPEYWEEVKDDAYQIISFSSNRWGDRLATLDEDGRYTTTTGGRGWSLQELLEVGASVKSGDIKIHSVKRISDGEIFTIGDKAKTTGKDHSHTITSFRIKQYCIGKDVKDNYLYDGVDKIWVDWEVKYGGNWLEFTEKVIEKDYQILKTCPIEGTIYSIKRLSDGEVFTVGDKFEANIGCRDVIRTIQKINVEGGRITIYHENGDLTNRKGSGIFHTIKKVKQPIFLTHDGKDIFEGDKVWYVNKENLYHDYAIALARTSFNSNTHAYFLTREGAEDYIEKNKVLFITEDGVGIYSYDTTVHWVIQGKYEYQLNTGKENVKLLQQQPDTYKVFSTQQAAEYYVLVNAKVLSIEDFWNFASQSGSNVAKSKRLKRLVKERLNIE